MQLLLHLACLFCLASRSCSDDVAPDTPQSHAYVGYTYTAAEERRVGTDRWMSAWHWAEEGAALILSFSGTDAPAAQSKAEREQRPVPVLQIRGENSADWGEKGVHRGWNSFGCSEWHFVRLRGLPLESETYLYRFGFEVGGQLLWLSGERRLSLRRPKPSGHVRLAAFADLWWELGGQTTVASIEEHIIRASASEDEHFHGLLSLGDMSYSGHCSAQYNAVKGGSFKGKHVLSCGIWEGGYWEHFRRYLADLSRIAALAPLFTVAGNHEFDHCMLHDYIARAEGMPYRESKSQTPFSWAMQLGPIYLIGILSEIGADGRGFPQLEVDWGDGNVQDWQGTFRMQHHSISSTHGRWTSRFEAEQYRRGLSHGSWQLTWLEAHLRKAWRRKRAGKVTWTIVLSHRNARLGGYCSRMYWECLKKEGLHEQQLELHRVLERLFFKYEVDAHLSGHTHGYERTFPVYQFEAQPDDKAAKTPSLQAPVYVTTPGSGSPGLSPEDIAPNVSFWSEPQPPHVARRLSHTLTGHVELVASPSQLQVLLVGQEANESVDPQVLDIVEYAAPTMQDQARRQAYIAEKLGGAHELPVTAVETSQCRNLIRASIRPKLIWLSAEGRAETARSCINGRHPGQAYWRVLFKTDSVRDAHHRGPSALLKKSVPKIVQDSQYAMTMAFFNELRKARNEHAVKIGHNGWFPIEQEVIVFLDVGLCLPAACDRTDLIGSTALPAMLNQTGVFRYMPVGFSDDWFQPRMYHAEKFADPSDAAKTDGPYGDLEMPRVDLIDPAMTARSRE